MGTKPRKVTRYCGRTTITITRREDGDGYDCRVFLGSKGWDGIVPQPFRLPDDGSPAMYDEIAKVAAHYSVAAGLEWWLNLDRRGSDFAVRRRDDFDSPVY